MPTITVTVTDAELAAVLAATKRPPSRFIQEQIATLVQGCVQQGRTSDLERVGVRSLNDLSDAEIAAIKAGRP